ncbi:hypothetical protein B0H13DRAFT_1915891 [Mycena leptocephala]|nr:hypothetical protein B0H13DRAFT_1915891 [Mycena leptocephala]
MGDGSGHTTLTTSNKLVLMWAAEVQSGRKRECRAVKARGGGAQGGSTVAKRAGDGVQNPTGWCQVDMGCRGMCRAGGSRSAGREKRAVVGCGGQQRRKGQGTVSRMSNEGYRPVLWVQEDDALGAPVGAWMLHKSMACWVAASICHIGQGGRALPPNGRGAGEQRAGRARESNYPKACSPETCLRETRQRGPPARLRVVLFHWPSLRLHHLDHSTTSSHAVAVRLLSLAGPSVLTPPFRRGSHPPFRDGYRIVVFEEFPHGSLLDRLGSSPSSGRFWRASPCWTLAVRLAGCDAAFDGVSALEAGELLDELTWDSDQNHMVPQGSKWSTSAGQEAIRTFFWARWRLARARTKCIQVQLPHTGLDTTVGVGSGNRSSTLRMRNVPALHPGAESVLSTTDCPRIPQLAALRTNVLDSGVPAIKIARNEYFKSVMAAARFNSSISTSFTYFYAIPRRTNTAVFMHPVQTFSCRSSLSTPRRRAARPSRSWAKERPCLNSGRTNKKARRILASLREIRVVSVEEIKGNNGDVCAKRNNSYPSTNRPKFLEIRDLPTETLNRIGVGGRRHVQ